MKTLIVEDDFLSRVLMQQLLLPYGETHVAVNGDEALSAFTMSLAEKNPYSLICLDIMMPGIDGKAVLKKIRELETAQGIMPGNGVKIIMTTALDDRKSIMGSFKDQCDAYMVKPIRRDQLIRHLKEFKLIE